MITKKPTNLAEEKKKKRSLREESRTLLLLKGPCVSRVDEKAGLYQKGYVNAK